MAGDNFIGKEWLQKHLEKLKKVAGPRYTPQLNVNLPISDIFLGISRTEGFYLSIRKNYGSLLREFKRIDSRYKNKEIQKTYNEFKKAISQLSKILKNLKKYSTKNIPWKTIFKLASEAEEISFKLSLEISEEKEKRDKEKEDLKNREYERHSSNIHYIYEIQNQIRFFKDFASSTQAKLSNSPFLLLTGIAGTGKTHLLCDVLEGRITGKKALPTVLVFGELFSNFENPIFQITRQLDLKISKEEFLKSLNNAGREANCRSLIIIDALNETRKRSFWKRNLKKLFNDVRKYPNVSLIVSVRNGFEKDVIANSLRPSFVEEEHRGFQFREWEAVNKFFNEFRLPLPEIPLLFPEFQNPLFLLLFCKAFEGRAKKNKNGQPRQIFRGHEGATYIFESFVDSVSRSIAKKFDIPNGAGKNIWDTVIEKIAAEMVIKSSDFVSEVDVESITKKAYPSVDYKELIKELERNLLIVKVPRYSPQKDGYDGFEFRFPFQKFSDHLIGRYIFKEYEKEFGKTGKNLKTAKKFFFKRRRLGKFLASSWNSGVIEALSIQCPEYLKGIEFLDVAPYLRSLYFTQGAFVQSLIWRKPSAFSPNKKDTLGYINTVARSANGDNDLLNAFLSVASVPNHPYNADFLHRHLSEFSMAERDARWSRFLHEQYGEKDTVDRIIEWGWSDYAKNHISDESIELCSVALVWFLTTANRFLRDKSTRALVSLLKSRLHIVLNLIKKFKNTNDPYILERLYAIAYGAVVHSQSKKKDLKKLAEWVYTNIFKDKKPPLSILTRDYARGIIEVALKEKVISETVRKYIHGPFISEWPKRIPSASWLKKKFYPDDMLQGKSQERGFFDIWSSVMYNLGSLGDFGNYVVDSKVSYWSGRRIGKNDPNRKYIYDKFKRTLNKQQKGLLERATNQFFGMDLSRILLMDFTSKVDPEEVKKKERQKKKEMSLAYTAFEKLLPAEKKKFFLKEVKPFLGDDGRLTDPLETFDVKVAQRWIFNRVVSLGYDPKLHSSFDSYVNRYDNSGRSEHKAERIGKKYQWIAFHEFMGLLSDHFEFKGDSWRDEKPEEFLGPWRPNIRDIDPSFLIKNDEHIKESVSLEKWISGHGKYEGWKSIKRDKNWLKKDTDIPKPENVIQLESDTGQDFLILKGYLDWQQDTLPENEKYDVPFRQLFYIIRSYIVKKEDSRKLYRWLVNKNIPGKEMPEAHEFYETFMSEYPNSEAFKDKRGNYNIWTKDGRGAKAIPVEVVVSEDIYLNEYTLDCSGDGGVSVKLPSKWLINKMRLKHVAMDGRFYDKTGKLIATPTSVFEDPFPSALLFDKNALLMFLNKNNYQIFWTVYGEKSLIGGGHYASNKDYAGRLEIDGVYKMDKRGIISGKIFKKFNK